MSSVPLCTIADLFGRTSEVHCCPVDPGLQQLFPVLPRRLDHYLLLLLNEASGRVHLDNRTITLHGRGILVVLPGTYHSFEGVQFTHGSALAFTHTFFSMRYNQNVLSTFAHLRSGADGFTIIEKERYGRISALFTYKCEELNTGLKDNMNVLRSLVNISLVELDRSGTVATASVDHTAASVKLRAFTELVEEHYMREKNPAFYADQLHITGNYLNKICKEADGRTAGEHIRDRALLEAQRLLLHTRLSVNEVADTLGYDNVPWFITFFKQQTGSSPKQFRDQQVR